MPDDIAESLYISSLLDQTSNEKGKGNTKNNRVKYDSVISINVENRTHCHLIHILKVQICNKGRKKNCMEKYNSLPHLSTYQFRTLSAL